MDTGFLANALFSLLLKKIVTPVEYKAQCSAIKLMLQDDVTGLVDVLTDFSVNSAKVDFTIETNSEKFNEIFKEWLDTVNIEVGTIPMGIKALAEEYFKERWKGSSFAVLQIAEWSKVAGTDLILPTKMFFVDGSSVHAEDVEEGNNNLSIDSYKYFVGEAKQAISSKSAIINRPYGRWFDKYPTPYLIKRGVYHNSEIIRSLKSKQTEILDQIIPYLLLAKKGSEALTLQGKTYSQTQLQEIANQFQELMTELKTTSLSDKQVKTPMRVTNFDEDLKHFIPDLSTIFAPALFEQAERNILSGLGFIDVIQGVSSTRRESTLNPKAFIQEVNSGVESFKDILKQLLVLIKYKNDTHIKYTNSDFYVCSSPVKAFMSDEFKTSIRSLYDRGCLSKRTYAELVGEVDFRTEIYRREKEAKEGIDYVMYPQVTQNQEDKGIDIQGLNPDGTPQDTNIPPDKQGVEKKNFNNASTDGDVIDDELVNSSENDLEMAVLKKKLRVTEKYLRYRQVEPNKFEEKSFRTVTLSPSKGIKAIVGKIKGAKTTTIQSYLFLKEKWTDKTAKIWLDQHSQAFVATVEKYDLITAPYNVLTDLPPAVKKLPSAQQTAWMHIWNNAYRYMLAKTGDAKQAEKYAFRVAWSQVKRVHASQSIWETLKDKFTKK
jgi:cation transport regulator ChaB/predicted transcriptional regulator YdeE